MNHDIITFIAYAFNRHCSDGHKDDFEHCSRATCRRARQLEVYLMLTRQWVEAAAWWLTGEGI